MRFAMLGSGAVGSYFGAKLVQARHDVTFIARGEQLRALEQHGLTLRQNDEEIRLTPVTTTEDVSTLGTVDAVLISVKTWQVDAVARQLARQQDQGTRFLTLENGVEAPHIVAQHVGIERTLGGLVRGFFQLDAPGIVRHLGVTPTIIFGQLDGPRSPEAEQLYRCFTDADIYSELTDDIEAALWEKFLLVTSLSGVGADIGLTIGEIRAHEPSRTRLRNVMAEIAAVAEARRIHLPADVVERTLKFVETFPVDATTSMQRDLMNHLPSELEAQTGAVVRLGQEAGIATPINEAIYERLIIRERQARGPA